MLGFSNRDYSSFVGILPGGLSLSMIAVRGPLPVHTFGTNVGPFPIRWVLHNDIVLLAAVSVHRFMECPVGVGDWLAARPTPFTLLCKVGQPDPIGVRSKDSPKPFLLCFIINRHQMCIFGDRLDVGVVPTLATDAFVSVSVCGIYHPYPRVRRWRG